MKTWQIVALGVACGVAGAAGAYAVMDAKGMIVPKASRKLADAAKALTTQGGK